MSHSLYRIATSTACGLALVLASGVALAQTTPPSGSSPSTTTPSTTPMTPNASGMGSGSTSPSTMPSTTQSTTPSTTPSTNQSTMPGSGGNTTGTMREPRADRN